MTNNPKNFALPAECRMAFKEWAVVCAALAAGRQTVILRKGGIHEGREGFRVEHRHFWLFPTAFHQQPQSLTADARDLFDSPIAQLPPSGIVRLQLFAEIQQVHEVRELAPLLAMSDRHVLAEEVVRQRFDYREPGLFVLVPRIYRLPTPIDIDALPAFDGCKSWVELPMAISTAGLELITTPAELGRTPNSTG